MAIQWANNFEAPECQAILCTKRCKPGSCSWKQISSFLLGQHIFVLSRLHVLTSKSPETITCFFDLVYKVYDCSFATVEWRLCHLKVNELSRILHYWVYQEKLYSILADVHYLMSISRSLLLHLTAKQYWLSSIKQLLSLVNLELLKYNHHYYTKKEQITKNSF